MKDGNGKINILLVDDNLANLLSLESILQAPDRNLVRASSGNDALNFLLDQDAAVILLDVRMPIIDGLETAALIRGRERTRNIPIIFMTAYDSGGAAGHITRGYALGAVDYITKPVEPEALKSKVAVFVELYRKTEQIKLQAQRNIEIENSNLQRLSRLIDLGQRLAAERDPVQVLEKLCDTAREILGARYASIGVLEDDGVTLRHFFTSGFDGESAIKSGVPQACQHLLKRRFKENRSLRMASAKKGLRILPDEALIKSFVGASILRQGQPRGWLFLADKIDATEFSEADERFAITLTQAVVFYENSRLYADLQRHAAALEQEITERKRAEYERAEMLSRALAAQSKAEEANRLKDEFLATVSHELRAPLTAMLGWITLARGDRLDNENKKRALETVEHNARVQKKLVDDLLDISSIVTGNYSLDIKPTDLLPVIESAVESVRPEADAKGVRIEMAVDPSSHIFLLDPNRFRQVIWNLVHNAVKFTPPGGEVEVRLRYINGQAEIEVIDTGVGISPDFLPYVFDRFRQANGSITRKHGGLGLGLAIVWSLVEMHGGAVSVESAGEGQGSTFRITLPVPVPGQLPQETLISDEDSIEPISEPKLTGLRVLVVDDQAEMRDLLGMILCLESAEVRAADSIDGAIRIMTSWNPQIVISDIAMPGGGGYELIRRLRESGCDVPAIALTARASDEDRNRALNAGFQMHLPKPIEPDDLVESIVNLTRKSTVLD